MTKDKDVSANRSATDKPKRKAPRTAWKKGQSGNPAGSPKRGESWAEIIKRVGEYTPPEAAARSLELSKQLLKIGEGVTLKEAAVLRMFGAILFDPQPGLVNILIERAEGKITQPIELAWREDARAAGLPPEVIDQMANELFDKALADAGDTSA